jgi:DNA-binding transcriptional ArsR family regulator
MVADTPMLAAVASPRRREILRLVWSEELAAGAIHRAMPDVTFGAVSLQLRALTTAGLVESRSEGRHRLYRARRDALGPVARMLEGMWSDALWRLKLQAELLDTRRGPAAGRARRRSATARKRGRPS